MVSRDQPEVAPSSDAHCTTDFWDRLVQQPSSLWMEEYQEAPPLLMSGCAAQRPEGEEGGPWPWEAAPTPLSLPSPKELCQKKRKGPKQKGLGHLRGLSVLYHLEEVKRRQSNIDNPFLSLCQMEGAPSETKASASPPELPSPLFPRQKAAQERGALPQLSPQRNGMVGDLPPCLPSPARMPEPYARPFLGGGTSAQLLLHPQWNPNLREPLRFPEESPLAFYAVAAHHRSLHGGSAELRPEE